MTAILLLMGIGLLSAALAAFGPFWMVPLAGLLYSVIGPVMWWHGARVQRACRNLTLETAEAA